MAVVCLLDDDPLQARFIIDNVHTTSHTVVWTRHSWDALLTMQRVRPNLLVVDCDVPQWVEFLTVLRTTRSFGTTPAVLLCAQAPAHYYVRKLGITKTIAKPFGAAALIEHISAVLNPSLSPA